MIEISGHDIILEQFSIVVHQHFLIFLTKAFEQIQAGNHVKNNIGMQIHHINQYFRVFFGPMYSRLMPFFDKLDKIVVSDDGLET